MIHYPASHTEILTLPEENQRLEHFPLMLALVVTSLPSGEFVSLQHDLWVNWQCQWHA
ncbi:hypothetical protein [Aquabacterium sp.]|uniref:hypothetical protein n=1 Tax=Aquabacterium sp. TaxID=1872578 RepID=UPI002488E19E|nr:hypothetical protein [Aquabacterium sp.]MDI1261205.1 hypothetical protein [Aquabacterium sp.]